MSQLIPNRWKLRCGAMALMAVIGAASLASNSSAADTPANKPAVKVHPDHPLAPALDHAYKAREALDAIKDYEAFFEKREHVGGRLVTTKTTLKVREKPFSVYMMFVEPNQGREVIFWEGKNNGNFWVHETGIKSIVGTVSLSPTSERAMEDNRYPITMIGIRKLLEQVIAQWEDETRFSEVEVKYYPNATLGELKMKAVETKHPQPRNQFKFHLTRLYLDRQTNLPVRLEQFGFPKPGDKAPPLVEEYSYTKLKTNIGLADKDFDIRNASYAFPE